MAGKALPAGKVPRKPRGRPSKFTPELGKRITQMVTIGVTMEVAAQANGIHKDTLYAWLAQGARQAEGKPLRHFSDAMHQAFAGAEATYALALAASAKRGNLQAIIFWLTHARRDNWRKAERLELTGKDGGPVQHEDVSNAKASLAAKLAKLKAKAAPPTEEEQ